MKGKLGVDYFDTPVVQDNDDITKFGEDNV